MSSILSQNTEFSHENLSRLDILQTVFHEQLNIRCWLLSDSEKAPFNPRTKTREWGNPELLLTFLEMVEALKIYPEYRPAIIPAYCGLIVLDLDKIRKTKEEGIPTWSTIVIRDFQSYTEFSQSGLGLHIVIKGEIPGSRTVGTCEGYKVEFLSKHPVTLTGDIGNDNPLPILEKKEALNEFYTWVFPPKEASRKNSYLHSPPLSNAEVIELLNKASNKEKFRKLFYEANLSDYSNDASSSDFALVSLISFYTQKEEQIFEVFKESALYRNLERQTKWSRADYRSATIGKAIASLTTTYQPKKEAVCSITSRTGTWENPTWPKIGGEPVDEPFPLHCLPRIMQTAISEIARDVKVDPAMVAVPALGTLALVSGKKVTVVEKEGLEHHPSLFLVCRASAVERKSETYKRINDPLRDRLDTDIKEWEQTKNLVNAHNESLQEQISAIKSKIRDTVKQPNNPTQSLDDLKKRLADLKGGFQILPPHPRNWGDDVTPEKVKRNLHLHNGVFGLFSSEGGTILHTIQNPDGQNATAKSLFTKATWGDDLDRDRISGGESGEGERWEQRSPALTIVAFVQPYIWKNFSEDPTMRSSGTLSRICVAMPRSLVGSRIESENDAPYDISKVLPFVDLLDKIRRWDPEKPIRVPLSREAAIERRHFFNSWETEVGPGGTYEDVADLVGRSASITARYALLLAVMRAAETNTLGQSSEITVNDWVDAQEIEEWFLTNGVDSIRSQTQSSEDCEGKAFRWLLKHFKEGNSAFLPSKLKDRCRFPTKEETEKVILSLVQRGVIRTGKKARNNSSYYEINPQIAEVKDEESDE